MGGRVHIPGTTEYMAPELVKRTATARGLTLGAGLPYARCSMTPFLADTTPAIYKRI